jgi:rRNA-processing protein FCF1
MSRLIARLSATATIGALASALVFVPTAAQAAMSKKDQAVVKHVKAQCKAKAAKDAKGLGFVEKWRLYSDCIHEAAKQNSGIDFSDIN